MKEKEYINEMVLDAAEQYLGWGRDSTSWEDISNGNINYIYRIKNESGESVVLKFADDDTRVGPSTPVLPNRNEHEASVLQWYAKCEPAFVPKVLAVNKEKHYFLMEDVGNTLTLKEAFVNNLKHPNLTMTLASFIVETTFPILDIVREGTDIELPCSDVIPTDLIQLTEDLVFTDPYYDPRHKNRYTKGNEDFIKELLDDDDLREEVEKLKNNFRTNKQSLIHGDLHSGSVLVHREKGRILDKPNMEDFADIFVIDPEFAFYGPISYDLGNVWAHILFAEAFHVYHSGNAFEGRIYMEMYQEMIGSFLTFFDVCAKEKLTGILTNSKYKDANFINDYIYKITEEAHRYAGCELIRRIVGSAKVPELGLVTNKTNRIFMERGLLDAAVRMVKYGHNDPTPGYSAVIRLYPRK